MPALFAFHNDRVESHPFPLDAKINGGITNHSLSATVCWSFWKEDVNISITTKEKGIIEHFFHVEK